MRKAVGILLALVVLGMATTALAEHRPIDPFGGTVRIQEHRPIDPFA